MAALTVGGVTITLDGEDVTQEYIEHNGDRTRMDDGTMRELAPTRKRVWGPMQTRLLTSSEESTQNTALVATPPISCAGDVLGATISCHVQLHGSDRISIGGTQFYRLRFTLYER